MFSSQGASKIFQDEISSNLNLIFLENNSSWNKTNKLNSDSASESSSDDNSQDQNDSDDSSDEEVLAVKRKGKKKERDMVMRVINDNPEDFGVRRSRRAGKSSRLSESDDSDSSHDYKRFVLNTYCRYY